MIKLLRQKLNDPNAPPIGKAVGSLSLNITNQVLLLLTTMILTRLMVPEDYGLYAVIVSLMLLLAIPFASGLPIFMIRHLSAANAKEEFGLFKGLTITSALWVAGGSTIIALVAYAAFPIVLPEQYQEYRLGLGLLITPPILIFCGTILRSLRKVLWGRFPEFFIQPAIFAASLSILFFSEKNSITVAETFTLHIASYGIALALALVILTWLYPVAARTAKAVYTQKLWIKSALPLLLAVGLIVINNNIDIIMVGTLADQEQAAQYRVASRLGGLVLFFLFAANNVMGPLISGHHAKNETKIAQSKITMMSRLIFICSLPLVMILCAFPSEILSLLFGDIYAAGTTALIILTLANGFSMSMGQAGHIMSITGKEKYTAYAALMAVVLNVGLNAYLIPKYGMNGAAIGTATSIIFWNGLLAYWTAVKAGYQTTILGPLFMSKR